MDITLPLDFKEFLRLLNTHGVEYLLIGGYAVGYHGYTRHECHGYLDSHASPECRAHGRGVARFWF